MHSERGTAELTAAARVREESGGVDPDAGMTYYSSRRSVGERLPRWICLSPELGKMGRNTGKRSARSTPQRSWTDNLLQTEDYLSQL